ncbi:MAG: SAM-dependent methyltransferase [Pseudomonadota bacterium]
MTTLADRLKALIVADGPLPVSTFMQLCLHDPQHGYYATRPGLGEDFRTAPETSQVFGELLGIWAALEWRAMGAPSRFNLVELGPGRGTLMADALRATRPVQGFQEAANIVLVEASPALREAQTDRLSPHGVAHVDALNDVPDGPSIILANEFLDCLPARQFVRDGEAWRERVIGLSETGDLVFGLAADRSPPGEAQLSGDAVEVQPGLALIVDALAEREAPFRALFIDYGPADGAPGDTLRAFKAGAQVDPLAAPGECDLTVDVDFSRLARHARAAGLGVAGPMPQGPFLGTLGIEARMRQLIQQNPDAASEIHRGVADLVEPDKMGLRFKAICLSSPDLPPPAGF